MVVLKFSEDGIYPFGRAVYFNHISETKFASNPEVLIWNWTEKGDEAHPSVA
jgi:hypothetical protein